MLKNYELYLKYTVDGKVFETTDLKTEHFEIKNFNRKNNIKIKIVPNCKLSISKCLITYNYDYKQNEKFFANGYQSWSLSREYGKSEKIFKMTLVASMVKNISYPCGDYSFVDYSKKSGEFHSFTYTYLRDGENVKLFGSLTERQGYTIFKSNMNNNTFMVEKDLEGIVIDSEYRIFDLVEYEGTYDEVFDNYFKDMKIPKPRLSHVRGYTSWYNYYKKINEKIITRDLDSMDKVIDNIDVFQIDDGFQSYTGDWLVLNDEKFPNGLKPITDKIHSKGVKAGLWLAPFNCQFDSVTAREHEDWLLRDKNGKLLTPTFAWGKTYTIDFYNEEANKYIREVFSKVFDEWNFDMVKLDFLYSICYVPRHNKTRGQIMCEAMDFLREVCGDKLILGCGVPLGPSFGKVDMCRVGSDMDISFKHKINHISHTREFVSTPHSIQDTIFRRHLDGRAFVNDPDVFYLRDFNLKFNDEQKMLLAKINHMFGNVLFVSENIGEYKEDKLSILKRTFEDKKYDIKYTEFIDKENVKIVYSAEGKNYEWTVNVYKGNNTLKEL